ncbi:hypothetical protein HanPSC8_Chr02g0048911 [Helianthus annuus]|nr:hypothetical protein HanIR_Chr11g0521331 [Helianthus annuus]KAJ0950494.1 hypothetical protein HanPSC8_Chr02g0048911 [Helianthus annuus]
MARRKSFASLFRCVRERGRCKLRKGGEVAITAVQDGDMAATPSILPFLSPM